MPRHYFAKYQSDDVIFAEGSEGEEFFVVITGCVGIYKAVNGRQELLHQIGPGELFGELAIINSTPRSASAVAIKPDTTVIAVDKARFLYLVSQQPGFAILAMETLSRWLGHNYDVAKTTSPTAQIERRNSGNGYTIVPVSENAWQFRSNTRSCNLYVFKGCRKTVVIDAGLSSDFDALAACLNSVGAPPETVDTIILTHEHFDHVAAVPRFTSRRVVAAHRLTAQKIANGDEFAIWGASFGESVPEFAIDMTLPEGAVIDTGDHRLRVFHTPGHTSGCISLLEEQQGLLVTGDLILAGGNLGGVFGSGNISDTIHSLETIRALRPRLHLPGHGPLSMETAKDVERALVTCRQLLSDTRAIFSALNTQNSVNKFMLSLRELYR